MLKVVLYGFVVLMLVYVLHYLFMKWIFNENSRKRVLGPLHSKLYALSKDVQEVLMANNIDFWAIAGTALGAGRHSAIIPWDDDIDFGIHETSCDALKRIDWNAIHCKLEAAGFGAKIVSNSDDSIFIDFFVHRLNDGVYEFVNKETRKIWPKYTIAKDILYPLQTRKFGNISIRTANNLDEQLKKNFGDKYTNQAYIMLPHSYSSGVHQFLWKTSPFIKYLHNSGKMDI
jgi:hypothetical protein